MITADNQDKLLISFKPEGYDVEIWNFTEYLLSDDFEFKAEIWTYNNTTAELAILRKRVGEPGFI